MAITTNGISTEYDAKNKLSLSFTPYNYSPNQAITYSRLYNYFTGDTNVTYGQNQCVKYSDIISASPQPTNLWYMYDDLASPYTITSQSEPSLNYRLDANTEGFSGHTCQYSLLNVDNMLRYYEQDDYGLWDQKHDQDPMLNYDVPGKLITVSNGYLFDKNGVRYPYCAFSNSDENAAANEFNGGAGYAYLSFTDLVQLLNQTSWGPYIWKVGDRFIPFIDFSAQSVTNVYAQMKEGKQFTLLYELDGSITWSQLHFSLQILQSIAIANTLIPFPVDSTIEVSNEDLTIWGCCIQSDGTVIQEASAINSETVFMITCEETMQTNTKYILAITFTKGPSAYNLYYLSQFALNTFDNDLSEPQIITFDYTRYDNDINPAIPLWTMTDLAIDTTALYKVNICDINYIPLEQSLQNGDYKIGTGGYCIINPNHDIMTEFDYTNGSPINELALVYERAPISSMSDVHVSSSVATSFEADSILKNTQPNIPAEYELWFIFKCASNYLGDVLQTLGYTSAVLCYFGSGHNTMYGDYGLYGFPESVLFDKHLSLLPDIHTTESLSISISIPQFGSIIEALQDAEQDVIGSRELSLEFYIFYKTYYYHYKILV